MRLRLTVDWSKAPDSGAGEVRFFGSDSSNVTIAVPVNKYAGPKEDGYRGFIEGDGYVALRRRIGSGSRLWARTRSTSCRTMGRTLSGLEMFR